LDSLSSKQPQTGRNQSANDAVAAVLHASDQYIAAFFRQFFMGFGASDQCPGGGPYNRALNFVAIAGIQSTNNPT
jgi:hypothetical protein